MAEFISEALINQLKQYMQQKPAREPAVNRGHRLRDIIGGRVNRYGRLNKSPKIQAKGLRGGGDVPPADNDNGNPNRPPKDKGKAIGENLTNQRWNLFAGNNVSVQRDFFPVGDNRNADVMASSSPSNPSYAVGGASLKPSQYDIVVDPLGIRGVAPVASPHGIIYAALGLRNFNPAAPVTITFSMVNEPVHTGRVWAAPPGLVCPVAAPLLTTTIMELVLMPDGYNGVTYDTGFYYVVMVHDYLAGITLEDTCDVEAHFHITGYEG